MAEYESYNPEEAIGARIPPPVSDEITPGEVAVDSFLTTLWFLLAFIWSVFWFLIWVVVLLPIFIVLLVVCHIINFIFNLFRRRG